MGWEEMLSTEVTITIPWTGGRDFQHEGRHFRVMGRLPREFGWCKFKIDGSRTAFFVGRGEPVDLFGRPAVLGYLVGNRLLRDGQVFNLNPVRMAEQAEEVFLAEDALPYFSRVSAVWWGNDKLIFRSVEFPLGPEADVLAAFEDGRTDLLDIPGVTPSLHFAFLFERWIIAEAARRRHEAELQRQREEAERRRLEQVAEMRRTMGDGELRRQLAKTDFAAAAKAALALTGAEYLSHRPQRAHEFVVRYRCRGHRLECIVNDDLAVIDAGVCLRGNDKLFTLESLPDTIREAEEQGLLHIWRHG